MIAIKPAGGPEVASSRLRAYRVCAELKNDIAIEIFNASRVDRYKTVIFQKSYSERDISLAAILKKKGVTIVLDQCDNHFIYNPKNVAEKDRANRLTRLSDLADYITASTKEIAKLFPHKKTLVLPDFIELYKRNIFKFLYIKLYHYSILIPSKLKLVWFGNAGSIDQQFGLCDLAAKIPWLESLNKIAPTHLTVISNSKKAYREYFSETTKFTHQYIEWQSWSYAHIVALHDICLIPITQNEFTVCKTNNRLALSLSAGVPTIADSIPSYLEFSDFCILDDWEKAKQLATGDLNTLRSMASSGKRYVCSKYSENNLKRIWLDALKNLV